MSYWTLEEDGDSYVLVPSQNAAMCLAAASTDEGAALSLQERSTADAGLTRFTLRQDDVPEAFGEAVRDDFMSGFLGQYYNKASTGHVLGGGGWWGDAEMFEVILDAFATTGDLKYKEIFDELVIDFCRRNGRDWSTTIRACTTVHTSASERSSGSRVRRTKSPPTRASTALRQWQHACLAS